MSGGSQEAETPHDKQCPHCGLYYQDKGVSFQMHTTACDGSSDDTDDGSATDDVPEQTPSATSTDTSHTPASDDPTMGTGETPDTSEMHELPCGHEEIDLTQYDAGDWVQCDDCDGKYRIS